MSITVHTTTGDVVVALTSSTLIRMDGKVTNASMLLVGSRVEVEAVHRADQSLAAVTITIELTNALSEIEGTVTEVGSDHLKIHTKSGDDVTVAVNADTIIRRNDHLAGLTDIKAGDRVSIFGNSGTDLNCRWVTSVAHEKSIARERQSGMSAFGVRGWRSRWGCSCKRP